MRPKPNLFDYPREMDAQYAADMREWVADAMQNAADRIEALLGDDDGIEPIETEPFLQFPRFKRFGYRLWFRIKGHWYGLP